MASQVLRLFSESHHLGQHTVTPRWRPAESFVSPICNFVVRDRWSAQVVLLSRYVDGAAHPDKPCWVPTNTSEENNGGQICMADCFKCSDERCVFPHCEICSALGNKADYVDDSICPSKDTAGCYADYAAVGDCLCSAPLELELQHERCKALCYNCDNTPCNKCEVCGPKTDTNCGEATSAGCFSVSDLEGNHDCECL